jgi:hypothetical protein
MSDEIPEVETAPAVVDETPFPEPVWSELTDSQKLDVLYRKLDDVIARVDWVAGALEQAVLPTLARVNELLNMAETMAASPMGATMVKRMTGGKGVRP